MALLTSGLLGFGYYLQFFRGVEPCPLCIFQRIAFIAFIGIAVVGFIHGPEKIVLRIYSGLMTLAALVGGSIAAWHVRLQHLPPDRIPECGPGLDYMLEVFPLTETLRMAFTGSGECAEISWTFLGFSVPEWSLFWFIVLASLAAVHCARKELLGPF